MYALLATAAETGGHQSPEVVAKGIFAVFIAVLVFIGSVYLLLSLILGARLAYFLTGSIVFGILVILSIIWFGSVLGPKGAPTTWEALGAGPDLQEVTGHGNTFDLRGYPGGDWKAPSKGDTPVEGAGDTLTESENAKPVLDTFVSQAVSLIPGVKEKAADKVTGEVELLPQNFAITDVRMRKDTVEGKESLIAVAKAVPADKMVAEDLQGTPEAEIVELLVKEGDSVSVGQPVLHVTAEGKGEFDVVASMQGRVVSVALAEGDKVKPGVPYATIDISGQPGQPAPVEVAAARVRGSQRTPATYYIIVSLLLFAVHMKGLGATEKKLKLQAQPA
ncbi:MAG: biotin/lipoyl-containing protein [Actinomycetota bacterium]